jgi:hypothetical protein
VCPGSKTPLFSSHLLTGDRVVETGASTALIIEDDVDWDVRLRTVLDDFATASRSLHNLTSPGPTNFRDLPPTQIVNSPYGEQWDVLWLGHCGMFLARSGALIIKDNDETVPKLQYLKSFEDWSPSPLTPYPPHSRMFMQQATDPSCSFAYAVSQKAARAVLHDIGIRRLTGPFDNMLRGWCVGLDSSEAHACYGVLPQLFDHYRREGKTDGDSDINAHGGGVREKAQTLNIRWSTRLNMERLLHGETEFDDQWPDA